MLINNPAVFETELLGIDGVPTPETINYKKTEASTPEAATETPVVEAAAASIVDTLKAKLDEGIKMIKSLLKDQDGLEEKAEL